MTAKSSPRVALFATCLTDLFRPGVGFAAVRLLEQAGYSVDVPAQGCCGQVNFNGGDRDGAREMAERQIRSLADFDYVVAPSGSCAAMIRCHYPELFESGSPERAAAEAVAGKTWELTSFLHDVARLNAISARFEGRAVYHDACSGLRELGVRSQPRALLARVAGLELVEAAQPEVCCGFGGLFCVKYPDVSADIVGRKARDIIESGADWVIAGDLGCLMHIAGRLHRDGSTIRAVHVAEVLAGEPDDDQSGAAHAD